MSDRTVHAFYDGMEIVRYDRAGKWYLEPTNSALPRQHVGVKQAARAALWGRDYANGRIHYGMLGGNVFERLTRTLA